ncbi:unnamed protein product [Pylaiella littoralis]
MREQQHAVLFVAHQNVFRDGAPLLWAPVYDLPWTFCAHFGSSHDRVQHFFCDHELDLGDEISVVSNNSNSKTPLGLLDIHQPLFRLWIVIEAVRLLVTSGLCP